MTPNPSSPTRSPTLGRPTQVANFSNKSKEMALRVSSLDYLGVVAARLRRDAVTSTARPELIEEIISEVKREERAAGLAAPQEDKEAAAETKKEKKKKKVCTQRERDVRW